MGDRLGIHGAVDIFWPGSASRSTSRNSNFSHLHQLQFVIQSVAPRHSGNYSCVASNSQGDAVSQSLQLRVKFKPVCSQSDTQTVFLPLSVQAEVLCRVTAHPPPSFWWWTFNNSHHLDQVTFTFNQPWW